MQEGLDREVLTPQALASAALDVTSALRSRPGKLSRVVVALSVASLQQFRVSITDGTTEYLLLDSTPGAATTSYVYVPDGKILLLENQRIRVRLANAGTPASTASPFVYLEN